MGSALHVRETASMQGIDANTGKALSGIDHLRQSVRDILSTPIGSRVCRREYGSQLFRLIDAPLNKSTVMDLYAATADALSRWEPRFQLTQVQAAMPEPGVVLLDLTGVYLPDGREITLDGIEVR
jgi:phage baseplate assembly protein W